MDYTGVSQFLGSKQRLPIKGKFATSLERLDSKTIALYYHQTAVVTWTAGRIVINNGGWETVTTKKRMNDWLPIVIQVYQQDWEWYVHINGLTEDFYNGMAFVKSAHGVWCFESSPRPVYHS